jgi:hypothetical protein
MEKEKITEEEAKKVIQEIEMEKQKKCFAEISPILDKYGYRLGTTQPQVIFIPKQ